MDHADAHLVVRELLQAGLDGLGRALHVGLDDQVQLLHLALLHLGKEVVERDLACELRGSVLLGLLALLDELTRHALVADGVELVAGGGRLGKTRDLHRDGRAGTRDRAALVVRHNADAADRRTGDDEVALMQRAVLNQQGRDRAAVLVQPCLDDNALAGAVRIGLQLGQLRRHDDRFEQLVDARAGLGGDAHDLGVAAPFGRDKVMLGELRQDAVGICARLIHFIDRDDDWNVRGLGVVDRLDGLRRQPESQYPCTLRRARASR